MGLGYLILEKNFRCRLGEIDIIAKDKGTIVFVEVKYRKNDKKGSPAEAVNFHKQRVICKVADYYRMIRHMTEEDSCRFDILSIEEKNITHLQNAFPYR
jgi:putative endonuclease